MQGLYTDLQNFRNVIQMGMWPSTFVLLAQVNRCLLRLCSSGKSMPWTLIFPVCWNRLISRKSLGRRDSGFAGVGGPNSSFPCFKQKAQLPQKLSVTPPSSAALAQPQLKSRNPRFTSWGAEFSFFLQLFQTPLEILLAVARSWTVVCLGCLVSA